MEHADGDRPVVADERLVVAVVADDTPYCATGPELVADRLFALGASAVSELADWLGDERGDGTQVRLVADLPAASVDALLASGLKFEVLERDPTWTDGWREHATSIAVGNRLVLRPEWVTADPARVDPSGAVAAGADAGDGGIVGADMADDGRIEVVLDAADAFGSGSHPTTRLCMEELERLNVDGLLVGARVLDVGCGTGVLGVAALLMGAGSLVAIDVDPNALAATRRTADLNGVNDRVIEVSDRTVSDVTAEHGPFDVVLANLLIPIIEDIGTEIASAVAPGGHLVLSGLIADPATGQVDRALAAVGFTDGNVEVLESGSWAAPIIG